jgi:hypothetical protein
MPGRAEKGKAKRAGSCWRRSLSNQHASVRPDMIGGMAAPRLCPVVQARDLGRKQDADMVCICICICAGYRAHKGRGRGRGGPDPAKEADPGPSVLLRFAPWVRFPSMPPLGNTMHTDTPCVLLRALSYLYVLCTPCFVQCVHLADSPNMYSM